jgi:sulfonate transport system substrate-binding protein
MNINKINKVLCIVCGILAILIIAIGSYFYIKKTKVTESHESINIGVPLQAASGALIVAWKKDFFKDAGINANILTYPSGKRSILYGLIPKDVDFAATGDIPFVLLGFKRNDVKILCAIGESESTKEVICRKDHGILTPDDLTGKIIATQKGSEVHYFLSSFLLHNMIDENDVKVKYMKAEELPLALIDGKIDAFCMREPYTGKAKNILGKNAIIFYEQQHYKSYEFLTYLADNRKINDDLINKIFKVMARSEKFIKENPEECKRIIAETIGTDISNIDKLWSNYTFDILSRDSIAFDLEDKARWAIKQHLTDKGAIPNYSGLADIKLEKISEQKE